MAYDKKKFNSEVKYYQNKLKSIKKDSFFFMYNVDNKKAYYSIAPLSRALHNLGKDLYVYGYWKNKKVFNLLSDIWTTYKNYKKNKRMDEKTAALLKFINYVDKKTKGKFKKNFEKPVILEADKENIKVEDKFELDYKNGWIVRKDSWKRLLETADIIWDQVYNLKKSEKVGISFELIPRDKDLEKPLTDFFDSYQIADAMLEGAKKICKNLGAGASTSRYKLSDYPEKVSELMATLIGCEYDKNINEPVFKLFKKVSKLFGMDILKPNSANFGIHGKGRHGRHLFGEAIGYPTKNRKSRWDSPAGMFYKFAWAPQSKYETRDPISRVGFTDTVKLKDFIATCHVDWYEMHRKNQKITNIVNKSEKIVVSGKKSNFVVHLVSKKGRRYAMNSDIDIRSMYEVDHYKRTGEKTGTMANLPGGESFVTPEYIEGVFYGDVVINIDDSYPLSAKNPLVVRFNKKGYVVEKGPKKILAKLEEKKKEAWDRLIEQEKNKSLPQSIINLKKKNFNGIG